MTRRIEIRVKLTAPLVLPANVVVHRSEYTKGVFTRIFVGGVCLVLEGWVKIERQNLATIRITQPFPDADRQNPRVAPARPSAESDDLKHRLARIEKYLAQLQAMWEQAPEVQDWLGSAGTAEVDGAKAQPAPNTNQQDTPAEPAQQVPELADTSLRLARIEKRLTNMKALLERNPQTKQGE